MIITRPKELKEILKKIGDEKKIFIVGCGECAATCETGGEKDVLRVKEILEKEGKTVTGWVVPEAPCVASQIKIALAKNKKAIKEADSVLALMCGLGVQSMTENDRDKKSIHVGCDTLFMGEVDKDGVLLERCSACGDCTLEETGGICAVTRCPKGLLDGPCGGTDKGKCEVDKDRDCVWTLIYNTLKERNKLYLMKDTHLPKDYSKMSKPRQLVPPSIAAKTQGPGKAQGAAK
ncbi:MAG: methylenetetrahydrofolate reductase C-terminal domain-containing protein [Candidatus Omnitrophica bacterium]|nr:methylenetetrahydrofolate reductase C-terminal domain-containing protein [Candidatus Omnitrophota bacterium]